MPSLSFGGGAGQYDSWAQVDAASLARLAPLPRVCPFGRICTSPSDLVESLGATLKIAYPISIPAVQLSGAATLGQSGDETYAADPSRKGKGPLDGVFVADGCVMPCTDNFTGVTLNSNLFVDDNSMTKPFPGTPGSSHCSATPRKWAAFSSTTSRARRAAPARRRARQRPRSSSSAVPSTP